jgi:hypothetical protein
MAQLHYHGKNGNALLDTEESRTCGSRTRFSERSFSGSVATSSIGAKLSSCWSTLILLRTQILTIPALVSSELRDLDNAQAHRVRIRIEDSIHRFLTQLAENMEATLRGEAFIKKLEAELNGKQDADATQLKHDLAKRRRTEKRHAKAQK